MSVQYGNARAITDGMILSADAIDSNSYLGEPTTNLVANGDMSDGLTANMNRYNSVGSTHVMQYDATHGINTTGCVKFTWDGTNDGGCGFNVSMTAGTTYVLSYMYRIESSNMLLFLLVHIIMMEQTGKVEILTLMVLH